ncbi:MAG: hypothetical protein V3T56_04325 [Gemmatimonadales bacterium]
MSLAVMSSGGKDSTLALDRARRGGLDVRFLANIYEGSTGRVRFHGVRQGLIATQARALGLEYVAAATSPQSFEDAFLATLRRLKASGVTGIIFGNIHLEDVRAWYEERVTANGLEHIEPLWGAPAVEIAWEVVERGYRPIIVGVDLARPAVAYLGREFDADVVTEMSTTDELDPCGEAGEYHTFVFDGPEFKTPVDYEVGETMEIDGHRFIDLVPSGHPVPKGVATP